MTDKLKRREFVKRSLTAAGAGVVLTNRNVHARVLGASDRVAVGIIGVGGRGSDLMRWVMEIAKAKDSAQIVAVSDVYRKRLRLAQEAANCQGHLDYRELIARKDIDAVIIATPDHWHAPIAIEALKAGKDVYLEKPMTHTAEEARQVYETVQKTGRVLQVGSQTTSSDQWWKARKAIASGMIGQLIMSQGSYHRNSVEGEWNWPILRGGGFRSAGFGGAGIAFGASIGRGGGGASGGWGTGAAGRGVTTPALRSPGGAATRSTLYTGGSTGGGAGRATNSATPAAACSAREPIAGNPRPGRPCARAATTARPRVPPPSLRHRPHSPA